MYGDDIIRIVAEYYHIPVDVVKSHSKFNKIIECRQISMYFMREYTELSLNDIGSYFQGKNKFKDHSSVLAAVNKVKNFMDIYPAFHAKVNNIRAILAGVVLASKLGDEVFQENDFYN